IIDVALGETVAAAIVAEKTVSAGEVADPMTPDGAAPLEVEMIKAVGDAHDGRARADGGVGDAHVVGSYAEAYLLSCVGFGLAITCPALHLVRWVGDRSDEAIPCAGNGLNEDFVGGVFGERLAQRGDIAIEVVLFDSAAWPDSVHKILF